MPKAKPAEFRRDVVALARRGDATFKQIAQDFGISEASVYNWVRQADIDDGHKPGVTADESVEIRELRKRLRIVEQENEILRRATAIYARDVLPK
jgi:transposase